MWCFRVRPSEQFHDEELLSLVFAKVVNGADAGMVQRRGRARLPMEPLRRRLVAGQFGRQELEGDLPSKVQILGLVDDPHAAAAELLAEAVVRNDRSRHRRHYRGRVTTSFVTWRLVAWRRALHARPAGGRGQRACGRSSTDSL